MKKRFGKNDIILLIVLLLCALIFWGLSSYLGKEKGNLIQITVDGELYGTYDLNKNQTIDVKIKGEVTNTVVIAEQKVYMQNANCPDKLCKKQGKKDKDGQTIVCLPNKVVVTVFSDESSEYDAIVN